MPTPKPKPQSSALDQLAAATPATRDRYVDLLRAASIIVVVLGHWLIASITRRGGVTQGVNALDAIPGLWAATWILQVMPIFFFVGGFSNLVTIRALRKRGLGFSAFVTSRFIRLLRPTTVFIAIWFPLTIALDAFTGLSDGVLDEATTLLTRPLWFIGIYLMMIVAAPLMANLHDRYAWGVPVGLVLGVIAVDVLSIGLQLPLVGYLNFPLVWLFVHQLGFQYADGKLAGSKLVNAASVVLGLGALVALTTWLGYSPSMVGLLNERSNTNPPTVAIVALTIWQVGLLMAIRAPVSRWLQNQRAWKSVIAINIVIMTLFLWHQTSVLAVVAALYPLGLPQPDIGTAAWWAVRPLWVATLAAFLALWIVIFGRWERPGPSRDGPPPAIPAPAVIAGMILGIFAILGLAVTGFDSPFRDSGEKLVGIATNPALSALCLVGAWSLLTSGGKTARSGMVIIAAVWTALGGLGWISPYSDSALALDPTNGTLFLIVAAICAAGIFARPSEPPVTT